MESCHRGAVAIADADGRVLLGLGDIERPIYPRSAVKALQAIPLIESGAADAFGLGQAELAIACASHSGDEAHIRAVRALLAKAGLDEAQLACGAHWPIGDRASRELSRVGKSPTPIHNNCSGKHAGMLATAVHLGLDPRGYERPEHHGAARDQARSFQRFATSHWSRMRSASTAARCRPLPCRLLRWRPGSPGSPAAEGSMPRAPRRRERLMDSCFAAPDLVAGEGRFDTIVMRGLPQTAFAKGGAEGVHCAALPALGIGIAVKVDDGTKRGAEMALAILLAKLVPGPNTSLPRQLAGEMRTWRGVKVGTVGPSPALKAAVRALPRQNATAAAAPR